ncbi:Copper chaperone domain-containing protein [Dioscorea alata]|uniref:Copper chaperone domain-containing protein n=1 Tax=Dioscorea alata TaxID=55571 RepID=A0ACB7VLE4_DIOAL|nr:Copper chaperone domain-containing protein [Dioscorea alata]
MTEENSFKREVTMELKVYMHCQACEKSVLKALNKFKGVDTVMIDRDRNKATVIGQIEPEKVLKKLRRKQEKKFDEFGTNMTLDLDLFNDENPNACFIM